MTEQNNSRAVIANAIIWAAVMIATSLIISDAFADSTGREKESLMLIFIMGWFATNAAITSNGKSVKAEWACFRKRFGKN